MSESLNPSELYLLEMADKHWKEHRPKMYQELQRTGQLRTALEEAARNTHEAKMRIQDELKEKSQPPQDFMERVQYETQIKETAWEMVREQWILLPSEEDVPNLGGDRAINI